MTDYICGFAAANDGDHCWINGHCVVCKTPQLNISKVIIEENQVNCKYCNKPFRYASCPECGYTVD